MPTSKKIIDVNANRKMLNIRDTTYQKLLDMGKMSESMDDLLNRLIVGYDDNKYNKIVSGKK